MNILKKYTKDGVVVTGTDNVELDTPSFEIVDVKIDTVAQVLHVEIVHEISQGTLTQKHSRTLQVPFAGLPASVKTTGLSFLQAIEAEILKLPQYSGATEI